MKDKGILSIILMKRKVVIFCLILLFIVGMACYNILPKQEYPIIQLPVDIITIVYPGATVSDMEELIATKVEDEVMQITGVDYCETECYGSVCVVSVVFEMDLEDGVYETSCDEIRNSVEDLRNTELPSGVTSINFNTDAADAAGIILAITGEGKSNEECAERAESLKRDIATIDGINHVEVTGEIEKQIKVSVNQDKLKYTGLSLSNIVSIVDAQNSSIPVGNIAFDTNKITINTSGKLTDMEEIENIIVGGSSDTGAVIKLKDIATIQVESEENAKRYYYNGQEAVLINIYFDEGVNVVTVGKEIRKVMKAYSRGLPTDIHLDEMIFLPDDVTISINDFIVNLIESILIVLIIVMVGASVRNGLIVSMVIPLSIFITFIAMKLMNIDIQFISLASLIVALGMLVDNAIVVSDAIQARYDAGEEKFSACVNGTKEVAMPVLASTLTTVLIFCSFYNLPGTMIDFIYSLPTIVIIALFASYIISIVVTPTLCFYLLKKSNPNKEKKSYVRPVFEKLLDWGFHHKKSILIISVIAVLMGGRILSTIEPSLMPYSEKMYLDMEIQSTNRNDIRKVENAVMSMQNLLKEEKEIKKYISTVGGRVPKYDFCSLPVIDSINKGCIVAKVDFSQSSRFKTKSEYKQYLKELFEHEISGVRIVIKELDVKPSSGEKIQVRVVGNDYDVLNSIAETIETELKQIPGSTDINAAIQRKGYDYYVEMKNDSLNTYGLTKAEVQDELNIAVMGRTSTIFRKDSKEYPIIVDSPIDGIQDLNNLMIQSSKGNKGRYRLKQVAEVGIKEDFSYRTRYNGRRCVLVTANAIDGYSTVSIENKLKEKVEQMDIKGATIIYEGDLSDYEESTKAMGQGGAIAALAIFLILFLQFNSYKQCLNILASIPFSIIGTAIGLKATGQTLSMFAILGIVSLVGVVVNNAIVLIDYINVERSKGASVEEACKMAVSRRFKPIVLSTTTTVFGLVPLAIGGNPLFTGMAIGFMCGLTSSLVFTLIVIPIIYSLLNGKKAVEADISEESEYNETIGYYINN